MKRTKAHALNTRATILDAAEDLFFRSGVTHTSLDEIADAAGVTRGAIYGHFRNKDAVFEGIFERFASPLDPFTVTLPADDLDPLVKLRRALEQRLSRVLRDTRTRRLYSIVFAQCDSSDEMQLFCQRVRAASQFAETQIEWALRLAHSNKHFSIDFEASQAAFFIHATLTGVLRKDLLQSRHDSRLNLSRIVGMTFQCLTQH
jgi:TetR/AcrR family acrAB operon transcriptional repressor